MERADEPTQVGTPINKALFDSIQNDIGTIINDKDTLSNVYNVGTLSTGKRTLTDTFDNPQEWTIESNLKVTHKLSGLTILTNSIYDDYNMERFVDGSDTSMAIYKSSYIDFQRPTAWKLKQILGKIWSEKSSGTFRQIRIGTENSLNVSGTYQTYADAVINTNTFDFTLDVEQTDFYLRSRSSSTNYEIRAYEIFGITYETNCNILTYTYPYAIADGTVVKYRTPSNLDTTIPTVIKIGNNEVNVGMREPNKNYEFIWNQPSSVKSGLPLSIKIGTITDGSTIPQSEGYLHYKYFVSPYSAGADSAESNSYVADGNGWSITCEVNQSTRVVTSKAVSKTRRDTSNSYTGITTKSATVNYIEFAWN